MLLKKSFVLLLFVVIKFILQYLLIDNGFDLHRDEYLHLDQARHLAWGFDSVPPFTSWISWVILKLGNSVFWVKFFPALFGALTIVVVWKTVESLGGGLYAMSLAATAVLLSVILRINMLYQPNSFDILAWTAFYYVLIMHIKTNENKWLYAAAVVFALGFLNKYNIACLMIGIAPAILITTCRKIFVNKHLYFALLLALLLVLPNIIWQFSNGLPVIHHMKELSATQLVNVNRGDFLKEQLLFFFGSVFIIVASWFSFFVCREFKQFRFVFWSFVFTLLLFSYLKAKGYYAIGLYPVLLAFGAVYVEEVLASGWKKWLRTVVFVIPLLFAVLLIRIGFPNAAPQVIAGRYGLYQKFGLLRWEDGKDHAMPQDFADMLGWKELATKVDSAYNLIDDKEHTLVFCDNYGLAGAVNYYSVNKNIHAVSMNADYVNWFPPASREITNLILVKDSYDDDPGRKKEQALFKSVRLTGKIVNPLARENGTRIYLLQHAKEPIMHFFAGEIEKVQKERSAFH